jgi:two-component system LytT family response regulator
MRVLIVDDEPLGVTALAAILDARSDVESFEVASDGSQALDKLERSSYDVVLLDINMPELSGIEVLDRLRGGGSDAIPSIVFVTAHDEHAITAFAKHAVDYVLKPFSNERINEALDVAVRRTAGERAAQLVAVLPHLQVAAGRSSKIGIKSGGRILFVDPKTVISVEAEGNYVLLRGEAASYVLRESISVMAQKLKEYGFVRIHRSALVNKAFVEEIRPQSTGQYGLRVKGGKEYAVTRTYKQNLKSLAQSWIGADLFCEK